MSIFDKFKKIFSSGSDDSFEEVKSPEEQVLNKALDDKAKFQDAVEKEQAAMLKNVNWSKIIQKVFKNTEVQELIKKLRDSYSKIDYSDISIFFDDISDGVDLIIEFMCKDESEDFIELTKIPMFKSQVAEALFKVISKPASEKKNDKYDYDAVSFNKVFNPEMNNLASLCRFISEFLRSYRRNPRVATNLILPYFESREYVQNFIELCYNIDMFVQNFRQITYNDISNEEKQRFLDTINSFVAGYSKNNVLTALNILMKTQKYYEQSNPKVDYSVIGGSL